MVLKLREACGLSPEVKYMKTALNHGGMDILRESCPRLARAVCCCFLKVVCLRTCHDGGAVLGSAAVLCDPWLRAAVDARLHAMCSTLRPTDCSCRAPLSLGFSRQERWSGLPFPSPGSSLTQGWNLPLLCLLHRIMWILYHMSPQGSLKMFTCF